MTQSLKKTILRATFGKIQDLHTLPHLLDVQTRSYEKLFSQDPHTKRSCIDELFHKSFPIENAIGTCSIEYIDLVIEDPIYPESLCLNSSLHYTHKLSAKFKITHYKKDKKDIRSVCSTQIYKAIIGDIPKMTSGGTFIINGLEKVCVMQLVRAPGVVFGKDKVMAHKKPQYVGRLIPERGSWLEVIDERNILYARIDKRRKFPVTIMLLALGYTPESILEMFYSKISVHVTHDSLGISKVTIDVNKLQTGNIVPFDIVNQGQTIVESYQVITSDNLQYIQDHDLEISCDTSILMNTRLLSPIDLGIHVLPVNHKVDQDTLDIVCAHKITYLDLVMEIRPAGGYEIAQTLHESVLQGAQDHLSALVVIGHILKGAELVNNIMDDREHMQLLDIYEKMFFRSDIYSLSPTGRFKLNYKLGRVGNEDHLTAPDLIDMLRYFLAVIYQEKPLDNADSLDNKRVKTVKDHVCSIINSGLYKTVQQSLDVINKSATSPDGLWKGADIINLRHIGLNIRDFFKQNSIVQFLEQDNELSQIAHKRRVTVLGPGGPSRLWSGIEIRDIDFTKYGRICAVETPEGLNVGLINSLTRYACLDKYGFITTPFIKVVNRFCTNEVMYLNSIEEQNYKIAPRGISFTRGLELLPGLITCRYRHEVHQCDSSEIEYIWIYPRIRYYLPPLP